MLVQVELCSPGLPWVLQDNDDVACVSFVLCLQLLELHPLKSPKFLNSSRVVPLKGLVCKTE